MPNKKWFHDNTIDEAKKYDSIQDFRRGSCGAYQAAHVNGWMEEIREFLPPQNVTYTDEDLFKAMALHDSAYAFLQADRGKYRACVARNILWDNFEPKKEVWDDKEKILARLRKCRTVREMYETAIGAIKAAIRLDFYDEATAHCPGVGTDCGFKRDKPAILYYLRVNVGEGFYKIGITNRTVAERYATDYRKVTVLKEWRFKVGEGAMKRERAIIRQFCDFIYDGPPPLKYVGVAEMFTKDVLGLDKAA